MLVRPEDMEIATVKTEVGIIKSIRFLGVNFLITVAYKGVDYKVEMMKSETLKVGDEVALNILNNQFRVFNE